MDTKSVFSLERDINNKISTSQDVKNTKVRIVEDVIRLETSLKLDYWEVDADWNGKVFRSVAQAKRHVRSGELPFELKIKNGRPGQVCVRLVTVQGKQYQLNI